MIYLHEPIFDNLCFDILISKIWRYPVIYGHMTDHVTFSFTTRSNNIRQVHHSLYDRSDQLRHYLRHSLSYPPTIPDLISVSGSYLSRPHHYCGWHTSCGWNSNCGWHNSCGCILVAHTINPDSAWLRLRPFLVFWRNIIFSISPSLRYINPISAVVRPQFVIDQIFP